MSSNTKTVKEILRDNNNIFKSFLFNNNYNIKFKKYKKFKTIIVIGMGGSILGAKAIYYFLKYKIKKKFIFIDDLNEKYLEQVKKETNLSNCLFLIISKSGNTSETILTLYYFKFFLKKNITQDFPLYVPEPRTIIILSFRHNIAPISVAICL